MLHPSIPVQTYRSTIRKHTAQPGSPPSRFSFTWVCALHPIDDGQLQVKQSTAGLTFCICSATHICCFDIGDQQKLKNPGYPDFLRKNKRERERLFFRFPVFDRFSSAKLHNLFFSFNKRGSRTPESCSPRGGNSFLRSCLWCFPQWCSRCRLSHSQQNRRDPRCRRHPM